MNEPGWSGPRTSGKRSRSSTAPLVHRAIADEVLPWLRGTWDPVGEARA
ncbi:hypothetical protein [Streptomyces kaniharaensis]|nr:hypothetical protein [Streptomyces kaniharaensis]